MYKIINKSSNVHFYFLIYIMLLLTKKKQKRRELSHVSEQPCKKVTTTKHLHLFKTPNIMNHNINKIFQATSRSSTSILALVKEAMVPLLMQIEEVARLNVPTSRHTAKTHPHCDVLRVEEGTSQKHQLSAA